jgi:large subunit ribosomal protein L22e
MHSLTILTICSSLSLIGQGTVVTCSRDILRLKGGGIQFQQHSLQQDESVMNVDEREIESRVKSRVAEKAATQRIVLATPAQIENSIYHGKAEGAVRFHAHANKIVVEHVGRKLKDKGLQKLDPERVNVMASKIKKSKQITLKKSSINCTLAVEHNLFNVSEFATYLRQRIKVDGDMGKLEGAISVELDNATSTIVVRAFKASQMKKKRIWSKRVYLSDTFSTRYLRYLTKKWICKQELKNFIRCVSTDFSKASLSKGGSGSMFEIRYTNIHKNRHLKLRIAREHGTRLEIARREYVDGFWKAHDANLTQMSREEMLLERRIKSTGERVGGLAHVLATRKTVAETERESAELLRHWVAVQRRSYRMPFGGAMRGVLDRSICRHDPDRVGKGTHAHSTAGYCSPRALRSRTGLRVGMESLLYTGTAPNGFRSARRRVVAQRLLERYQATRRRITKGYSVQGEADRRIYNFKPKWMLSGKMDLHKRDWR